MKQSTTAMNIYIVFIVVLLLSYKNELLDIARIDCPLLNSTKIE